MIINVRFKNGDNTSGEIDMVEEEVFQYILDLEADTPSAPCGFILKVANPDGTASKMWIRNTEITSIVFPVPEEMYQSGVDQARKLYTSYIEERDAPQAKPSTDRTGQFL
jgi:hypothetical protein